MKTNDIRRVIDASLGGVTLTPEQRARLLDRALGSIEEQTSPSPRKKIVRWIAVAALIALLSLALLAPAVGGTARQEELEKTGEQVILRLSHGEEVSNLREGAYIPEEIGELWGTEFRDTLIDYGAQALLPRWCPEGFEFDSINTLPDFGDVCVRLRNESGESIKLDVMVMNDDYLGSTMQIESLPGTEETWTYGGINYEYSENYNNCSVLWTEGNCRVYLRTPRDRELAMKIIESIYE